MLGESIGAPGAAQALSGEMRGNARIRGTSCTGRPQPGFFADSERPT